MDKKFREVKEIQQQRTEFETQFYMFTPHILCCACVYIYIPLFYGLYRLYDLYSLFIECLED